MKRIEVISKKPLLINLIVSSLGIEKLDNMQITFFPFKQTLLNKSVSLICGKMISM